jgi:outer membrane protein insertion porin family
MAALALALGCGCASPAPPLASTPASTRPPATSARPAAVAAPAPPSCPASKAPPSGSIDAIVRVEVRGNVRIPLADICAALTTRAGDMIDEEHVRHDIRALWDSGLVDDVSVSSNVSAESRSVTFLIHERPLVRTWTARGVSAVDPAHVRELLASGGPVFDPVSLRNQIALLREEYLAEGYRSVDIQHEAEDAPDNQVDIKLDVREGPRATIKAIRLEGVSRGRESEVRALIDTGAGRINAAGAIYQPDSLERDRLLIAAYYYDRGMVDIQVSPEQVTLSEDRASLSIAIAITEGPVYRLSGTACVGELANTERMCLDLLGVRKGDIFSRAQILKGIERIRELQVKSQRDSQIDVRTELDRTKHTVSLTIAIGK